MGRLFWKIFLWFLAVLLLMTAALIWAQRFSSNLDGEHDNLLRRTLNMRLDAVAMIMRHGGADAVRDYLTNSPPTSLRLWVLDDSNNDLLNRRYPIRMRLVDPVRLLSRKVTDPNGTNYQLIIYRPLVIERHLLNISKKSGYDRWPQLMLILSCAALASAWLAWYITQPIRLLRASIHAMTTGENKELITPKLGRRKDELTELAAEYDQMADALDSNQKALRQLLNDVSHELRSPLTRLRLQLGLFQQGEKKVNEEQWGRMDAELSRLDDLVHQVLTMARMEAGQNYQLTDYIDIVALVHELSTNLKLELEVKDIHLNISSQLNEIVLPANQELLRRALENILRNAIQHTLSGKSINVLIVGREDQVEIRVHDSGPGVDESDLSTIFQPFFRADNSRSRTGGYGLGLSIAHRAIILHQGTVSAHNHLEGGLEIILKLPAGKYL